MISSLTSDIDKSKLFPTLHELSIAVKYRWVQPCDPRFPLILQMLAGLKSLTVQQLYVAFQEINSDRAVEPFKATHVQLERQLMADLGRTADGMISKGDPSLERLERS